MMMLRYPSVPGAPEFPAGALAKAVIELRDAAEFSFGPMRSLALRCAADALNDAGYPELADEALAIDPYSNPRLAEDLCDAVQALLEGRP